MNLKPTLQQKINEDLKKQEHYKKEYGIEDEQVVVVEKSNMGKFTIKLIMMLFRISINIIIFTLACIGLFCLIYPNIRITLITELLEIANQLFGFF